MYSIHHSFDIDLATEYGLDAAILIHHFQHWIRINQKQKKNFHEGRTWMYQKIQDIADHFPYFTFEQIRNILERLTEGKSRNAEGKGSFIKPVLMKGNFNKTAFDRTTWYAFIDEEKFINSNNFYERENSQMDEGELPNPNVRTTTPIPDTKTDTKTLKKEKEEKERGQAPQPPPPLKKEESFFEKEAVKMPLRKYQALVEQFSQKEVDYIIDDMILYAKSQPKKFKKYEDHYAVVAQWIRRERKKQEETEQWNKNNAFQKKNWKETNGLKDKNSMSLGLGTCKEDFSGHETLEQVFRREGLIP